MSNKQQLQTNNIKVASLIETLKGKAAGGGGGGGNVETCTVTLQGVDNNEQYPIGRKIFYIQSNGAIGEVLLNSQATTETMSCGLVTVHDILGAPINDAACSGEIELLYFGYDSCTFHIYGDCQITIS